MTKVAPHTIATLSYVLKALESGEEIENISLDEPADFAFEPDQLMPAFEKNLMGLQAGDSFDFAVMAEDAYGKKDNYAVFDIPKDTFEEKGKIDEKMLQIGNIIPMTDNEGNKHMGQLIAIGQDAVTLDFNHPLAGVNLQFTGKVINVRTKS